MAEQLKIIPLGGLNEIGKNMTVYEYGGEIIVVDCGMAFPGDDMYGIDCVIPDVTYLVKHQNRIRGMFITHGHEDHIGAVPYILKKVNIPIYCTRLTAGLIRLKLEEHGLLKSTKIVTVESGMTVKAGKFSVEFIHVNHSIAPLSRSPSTQDLAPLSTRATSRSTRRPSTARSSTLPASASLASRAFWRCSRIRRTSSAQATR